MTATSIQYIGLTLTYASSFQMLRGAVIIFTGILSVVFLRRRLEWFRWTGMILVIGGLVTVGLTDILFTPNGKNSTQIQPTPEYNATYQSQFNYGSIMLGKMEENSDDHNPQSILLGDVLIVCAQVFIVFLLMGFHFQV